MRLPFWVDYHHRLLRRDKTYRLLILGWLALAAAVCFVLVPRVGHWLELKSLASTVDGRVAAAEEARPAATTESGYAAGPEAPVAATLCFSSGPGLRAVTERCATEGVSIIGYRPFRPDHGESGVIEALELGLEGPYPGVKAVLLWLENGPAQASLRQLEVTSGEGKVTAVTTAVQRVGSTPDTIEQPPVLERRPDIFDRGITF